MKKILISFLCGIAFAAPALFAYSYSFKDVNPGDWFYGSVMRMAEIGVIKGNPDGSFGPSKNISRAETATMFDRYNDYAKTQFAPIDSSNSVSLEILSHSLTQEADLWTLSGVIRNNGQIKAKAAQAIVVFYDNKDKRLTISRVYSDPIDLEAGQQGNIQQTMPPLENYDHYTMDIYK